MTAEPKTRRVRRSTTTGTERMRKTRATLAERGLTRLDVTISEKTMAEIDRRADEKRTSRGEIIALAIEATRENPMEAY